MGTCGLTLWEKRATVSCKMRFLMFCLFFGFICAQKDENGINKGMPRKDENGINKGKPSTVMTSSDLAQAIKELTSQVDELKDQNCDERINNLENELDHLTNNVNSRIEALETTVGKVRRGDMSLSE